jgi:hypothetical protein
MTTTLKCIYAAIMLFAVLIVIGGKFPSIGRQFLDVPGDHQGGDLYQMCELDRFEEVIPSSKRTPMENIDEADVLTMGDSFFNITAGSDIFAAELANKGELKVCNLRSSTFGAAGSPLSFLIKTGYKANKNRILLLEHAERTVLDNFNGFNAVNTFSDMHDNPIYSAFRNNDVEFFFKNNMIVHPWIRWLKNVRFKYFKVIDGSIASYSETPDMLFYQPDIEFSKLKKTDAMLDLVAESLARLSVTLKKRYNIDLIYMVIPDKYSVYHDLVPNGYIYDDFIPRLSKKLTNRGVKNIDVYTLYSRYNKPGMPLLYYSSDTHYTTYGKSLLVNACIEKIMRSCR